MATITMSLEEYERLMELVERAAMGPVGVTGLGTSNTVRMANPSFRDPPVIKPKRRVSAYHKRLGREIKALRARHLLKNGKWRKGWSQRKMMQAAHKAAKKS